ncbi:CBS domain-containing protein [Pseudomonadales bacterium]|nr:CBS domain-containing protein [Pseudomonadales bacterium]
MSVEIENLAIKESASIKSALEKIHQNHYGMILVEDAAGKIIGIATDGDIRNGILSGVTVEDNISSCTNYNFVSAVIGTPREQLIKRLDRDIKVIPILDERGTLQSVISKNNLPLEDERSIYIRSRAPVRVSFGGGGSDLTHYFEDSSGAVINTAISIYSHGTMKVRNDFKIIIRSFDLDAILIAENLADAICQKGPFGLVQALLDVVKPSYGFELNLNSDFPVGSGLGGSATLSAVVLGCFNMLREDEWNQHELAEIAFQAERLHLGIAGGWQDQYAAVFGGFNFIEFHADENIVHPIRVHADIALELEESLILCDTGIEHHSGNIHDNQKQTMTSVAVRKMVKANVELSYATRNHLLRGELSKFGDCLDRAWRLKRNFSSMISSEYIDDIYNGAKENGASGGKLLGAGGGGFFLFYVSPFKKHALMSYLKSRNLRLLPFRFEPDGLKTWKSRESATSIAEEKQSQ